MSKAKKINPRRIELIELSKAARGLIELNAEEIDGIEDLTINNVIKKVFYPAGEYHLFNEWKERGYKVVKGSKGFPVWGKKRKMKHTDEETGDESEFAMFPMAYLFHESQVEKIVEEASA